MSVKIKEKELYNLRDSIINLSMTLYEMMDDFETNINNFVASTSLTGEIGENVKTYFSETHISVINMIRTYIKEYMFNSVIYCMHLWDIDSNVNAVIDTEVLAKCTQDFVQIKEGFHSLIARFGAISRSVSNIINLYQNYTYRGGMIANGSMEYKFDYAAVDIEARRIGYEQFDVLEMPYKVEPMQYNRTAIKTLIAELRDKQLSDISDYSPGDLSKCESFFEANQAYENTKHQVDGMSVEEFIEATGDDKAEYQLRKLGLVISAGYSLVQTIKGAIEAGKTITAGIALCATYNPVTGVTLIIKGGKEGLDSIDNLYGTVMYTYAIATDDVYYEHTSGSDYIGGLIVDEVFGGEGGVYEASGTTASIAMSMIETYYKSESAEWTIAYTAYNYAVDEVVLPEVSSSINEQMSEAYGFDVSNTGWGTLTDIAVDKVGSGKLDGLDEQMTFNEIK